MADSIELHNPCDPRIGAEIQALLERHVGDEAGRRLARVGRWFSGE